MNKWYANRRPRRTYRLIVRSYLGVVIVTLLFNAASALLSSQSMERQIITANGHALRQFQTLMDTRLNEIEVFADRLAYHPDIKRLATQQWSRKTPEHYYLLAQICNNVMSTYNQSALIGRCYVWFIRDAYLLTGAGRYDAESFYQTQVVPLGIRLPFTAWRTLNEQMVTRGYLAVETENGPPQLLYLRNVITSAGWMQRAVVGILLDGSTILSDIAASAWFESSGVGILDDTGACLIASDDAVALRAVQLSGAYSAEGQRMSLAGEDCYVLSVPSRISGWRFVSITPMNALMDPRNRMLRLSAWLLLGGLALAAALAVVLARRQYAPLRRVVDALGGEHVSGGEYHFVECAIADIRQEKDVLQRMLDGAVNSLRDSGLIQLLLDQTLAPEDARKLMEECGIDFPHAGFLVLVCHVAREEGAEDDGEAPVSLRDMLLTVLRERESAHYLFKLRGRVVGIVNAPLCEERPRQLERAGRGVMAMLSEKLNLTFVMGISRQMNGLSALPEAYRQALETDGYLGFLGNGGVSVYEASPDADMALSVWTDGDERRLSNLLAAGEYAQACRVFEEIGDKLLYTRDASLPMLRFRMFKLLDTLLRVMNECMPGAQQRMLARIQPTGRWLECESLTEMRRRLSDLMCQAVDMLQQHADAGEEAPWIERAKAIIRDQYASPNLSVQSLAEQLGISQTTLARGFKRSLHCNALDYLHQYRLRVAKKLMREETWGIQQISERTGFQNSVTFIRVFKKYEGITPGAFRKTAL